MFLRIIFFKIYKYEIIVVSLSRTLAYILNPAMHKSSCFKILKTTKFINCDDLTVKGNIIVLPLLWCQLLLYVLLANRMYAS